MSKGPVVGRPNRVFGGPGDSVALLKVVAVPMAKRAAPAVAALVAGGVVGFLLGRRRNRRSDDLLAAITRLMS